MNREEWKMFKAEVREFNQPLAVIIMTEQITF